MRIQVAGTEILGLLHIIDGYPVNYFKDLKKLQIGDEIIYKTDKGSKTYQVTTVKTIEETDWSYLKPTKDNRITLITCVEDKPELRRMVQGVEV